MYNKVSSNKMKPYSTKEFLNLVGLKRVQCFDIMKYLNLEISSYKLGKKECLCFDDEDVKAVRQFVEEHQNIKLFLQQDSSLKKYGVDNPWKADEVKEKIRQTNLDKYGVEYPTQNEQVLGKIRNTCLDKYGCEYYTSTDEFKEKSKQTCMDHLGVDNPWKSREIIENIKETNMRKYGVSNYTKTEEYKEKTRNTCLDKYGTERYVDSDDFKEKFRRTCLDKYGVEHISQSEEIINKKRITHENKISNFENENNCILISKLVKEYGQAWLALNDIPRLPFGKYVFISKDYLPKIDEYSKNNVGTSSHPEIEVLDFVKSICTYNVISGDRTVISPLELDIYIPDKKLAIEFNGNFWHSSSEKEKKYHENKSKLCEEKGIRLIHIYECEWRNQQEKIKSLIRLALGVGYSKIGARECEIKKIDNSIAKPFNDKNHLQNHRNALVTYGLYYKGELQQLMSFSHNKKYEWEIIRGCPGSNNQVIGGVSKLFKAFVREYNPKSVFSYCDFNKFDGKGYEAIGMKFIGYTGPDKFYVDKSGCKVMRNPKKRKELESNCDLIIYGAGSKKYLWNNL